jgi:hypothetical protein
MTDLPDRHVVNGERVRFISSPGRPLPTGSALPFLFVISFFVLS